MAKKWIFQGAFMYGGAKYITWIRPSFMNEDYTWNFESKTEVASTEEIARAMRENDSYYTKL